MSRKPKSIKAKSISGISRKLKENDEIDVETFLEDNKIPFQLILLAFDNLSCENFMESYKLDETTFLPFKIDQDETVNKLSFKLGIIIGNYLYQRDKHETILMKFVEVQTQEVHNESLVIIGYGDLGCVWNPDSIRKIIVSHLPLKIVLRIETENDVKEEVDPDQEEMISDEYQEEMNLLQHESISNHVAFFEHTLPINLGEFCEEEFELWQKFLFHIISNILDLQCNYDQYLSGIEEVKLEEVQTFHRMSDFVNYESYFQHHPHLDWNVEAILGKMIIEVSEDSIGLEVDPSKNGSSNVEEHSFSSEVVDACIHKIVQKSSDDFNTQTVLRFIADNNVYFYQPVTKSILVKNLQKIFESDDSIHFMNLQDPNWILVKSRMNQNPLKIQRMTLPGRLSFRNYVKYIEPTIRQWIQDEFPYLKHLLTKNECRTRISSTSLVEKIVHQDLLNYEDNKKIFDDLILFDELLPNHSTWFDLFEGSSLDCEETQLNFGLLSVMIRKWNDKVQDVHCRTRFETGELLLIRTDLPKQKCVKEVVYVTENDARVIFCRKSVVSSNDTLNNESTLDTKTVVKSRASSRKSRVTIDPKVSITKNRMKSDSDSMKSYSSAKSRLKKRKASRTTLFEPIPEDVPIVERFDFNIYLKNGTNCYINKENSVEQTLQERKFIYLPNSSIVIIQKQHARILTSTGVCFDISKEVVPDVEVKESEAFLLIPEINKELEEETNNDAELNMIDHLTKIYSHEISILKSAFEAVPEFHNEHIGDQVEVETKIKLTTSDGKNFLIKNFKVIPSNEASDHLCWDYFNYMTGEMFVLRDDGVRFIYKNDEMLVLYPEDQFLFQTHLDEYLLAPIVLEFDESLEDPDEIMGNIVERVVSFASSEQFRCVRKRVMIQHEQLVTVVVNETQDDERYKDYPQKRNDSHVYDCIIEDTTVSLLKDKSYKVFNKLMELKINESHLLLNSREISTDEVKISMNNNTNESFIELLQPNQSKTVLNWNLEMSETHLNNHKMVTDSKKNHLEKILIMNQNLNEGFIIRDAKDVQHSIKSLRKDPKTTIYDTGNDSFVLIQEIDDNPTLVEKFLNQFMNGVGQVTDCCAKLKNDSWKSQPMQTEVFLSSKSLVTEMESLLKNSDGDESVVEQILTKYVMKALKSPSKPELKQSKCFNKVIHDIRTKNDRLRTYLTLLMFDDYKSINYWDYHYLAKDDISNLPLKILKSAVNHDHRSTKEDDSLI